MKFLSSFLSSFVSNIIKYLPKYFLKYSLLEKGTGFPAPKMRSPSFISQPWLSGVYGGNIQMPPMEDPLTVHSIHLVD